MKKLTLILSTIISLNVFAQRDIAVEVSSQAIGKLLGQASISRHVQPSHKLVLQSVLMGSSDPSHHSFVTYVRCQANVWANLTTCRIGISTIGNPSEDYDAAYELKVETDYDDPGHMMSVDMQLTAG